MRALALMLTAVVTALANPASACPALSTDYAERLERSIARRLASSQHVRGTYRMLRQDEAANTETGEIVDSHGQRLAQVNFVMNPELMICDGLSRLTRDGMSGRFYLDRETGALIHFRVDIARRVAR